VSVSQLPEGVSLVDLLRELAELRRVVVVQAGSDCGVGTPVDEGFLNVVAPAGFGCAVGQEAGEETVVTDPIWAEPGKATGFAVVVAKVGRRSGRGVRGRPGPVCPV
jgi:hypothetical protein